MKKGQVLEGIVENVDFPNKGIVHIDDYKIVIKNVIQGQKIRFSINKIRKNKCEGRLLEIIEKSKLETEEKKCRNFGQCGGCSYQNIPYNIQLDLKKSQVKNLIDTVYDDYIFEGIEPSPKNFAYRNKMEFSFGDEFKNGPLSLGLHKKGSFHDILTTDDCYLVDNDFNKILKFTLDYFTKNNINFYKKSTHTGYLRHLIIRKAAKTKEILVGLVTSSQQQIDLKNYAENLNNIKYLGEIVGIIHIINDSVADAVKADNIKILYGKDYFYEEILGLKFKITPFSFFQTNSLGAEVLYNIVKQFIGDIKDKIVFDLYSGTGTISQIISTVSKKVIGVEIVEEAVIAARENAKLNNITNCEFIVGDVLKVLDNIKEIPDIIILDPPRDGINPKALTKILKYQVTNIIYISCKPTSLSRDLEVFKENGYKLEKVKCVDMFPQAVHVETVCLLSKLNVNHHIEVELNLDEMDLTKVESKATYEEIKEYVLEHNGLEGK